ncbi:MULTISPECIES: hypothetical protein [Bacillus]|uniref:Membrane protein n=4 Tax=Bacillus cereus group TaxID=86661 RepID=A0A6L8NW81_BACAN|nr:MULTISPECIES: hypothetical protein [Bacillus]EJT17821.1 Membrane protein [Bacillus anthracis str. UR-1]AAP27321.1 putative membrane protein [Bacillus anthracis str. Ames]AAT32670.1 putative membrane protein [Bacillus anthracis str. 'Ames Ancestor']AAT55611.1 membrane protein, putative [Bacillus anthracis str. Sterne]ACP15402.1 putative membrane protein [Bacillus anthracis str. CDC 684]
MEKYHGKSTEQIIQKLMPGSARSSVVMVWVVINFMILTPFLFPPTFTIYLYVILPFLLIANIWGVWVFFYKPNELRLVHILYNGFMGITFSFGSFIVIQKMAYTFIKIETPLFFIVTFVLYIFTIYKLISIGMKSFLRRLNNEENDNIKISPIVYLSGLGYVIGQICIGTLSQNGLATVLILVFSLFAVVLSISGVYIWVYVDLKRKEMDGMHNGQI